ncbi:hypothetical protein Btru_073488 [Bulinus truncatus]|nr:hypothetical protein Btru_073488 [Bulinus truncatus]
MQLSLSLSLSGDPGTAPQLHNIGKDSASYKGSFSVTSDRSSRLDPHTYQSYAAGQGHQLAEDSFDDTEEIIELYSELEAAQSQKNSSSTLQT